MYNKLQRNDEKVHEYLCQFNWALNASRNENILNHLIKLKEAEVKLAYGVTEERTIEYASNRVATCLVSRKRNAAK